MGCLCYNHTAGVIDTIFKNLNTAFIILIVAYLKVNFSRGLHRGVNY